MNPLLITPTAAAPVTSRSLRLATPADLSLIVHLQAVYSDALGFLPTQVHERYISAGQVVIVMENNAPAGFVSYIPAKTGVCRIPQVAVHPDLLRTALGTSLICCLADAALNGGCTMLRLTSRSDLQCNAAWPVLGFLPSGYQTPRNSRKRPLIEWTLPLWRDADLDAALKHHVTLAPYTPPERTPAPRFGDLPCDAYYASLRC